MVARSLVLDADLHTRTLAGSVQIADAQAKMWPRLPLLSPFDVMRVLARERIKFVLIGYFGLCGWRNQARAAGYAEVVVGRSVAQKAIDALHAKFRNLGLRESEDAFELLHASATYPAMKVVKPVVEPYCEVMRNSVAIRADKLDYRIPDLEMALVLTFADLTRPNGDYAKKYQAAHDFICMVKANENMNRRKLVHLASLIRRGGGKKLLDMIRMVHSGDAMRLVE